MRVWASLVQYLTFACTLQRRYSVVKVEVSQTYEKGKPKPGGLSDLKMGTLDRTLKCETDGAGVQDSPGYFGHIELAKPMYHIGFISTVVKVLRCVSFHSSKLLCSAVSSMASHYHIRTMLNWQLTTC